jgi:hypothetical protein
MKEMSKQLQEQLDYFEKQNQFNYSRKSKPEPKPILEIKPFNPNFTKQFIKPIPIVNKSKEPIYSNSNNLNILKNNLTKIIKIKYKSVNQFLNQHNLPKTQIFEILYKENPNPRFQTIDKIATSLNIPITELFLC